MPQVGASHEVKAVDEPESGCWRGVVCYPSDLMRHGHNNLKLGMRHGHNNLKLGMRHGHNNLNRSTLSTTISMG